jgi:hypothetical protein
MITVAELAARGLGSLLTTATKRRFGTVQAGLGRDVLIGCARQRQTAAGDYANFILPCLAHDITSSARQWIANLYANVFQAERDVSLSGPQMSVRT